MEYFVKIKYPDFHPNLKTRAHFRTYVLFFSEASFICIKILVKPPFLLTVWHTWWTTNYVENQKVLVKKWMPIMLLSEKLNKKYGKYIFSTRWTLILYPFNKENINNSKKSFSFTTLMEDNSSEKNTSFVLFLICQIILLYCAISFLFKFFSEESFSFPFSSSLFFPASSKSSHQHFLFCTSCIDLYNWCYFLLAWNKCLWSDN